MKPLTLLLVSGLVFGLTAATASRAGAPVRAGGYRLYPVPKTLARQCAVAQSHVRFPVLCPTLLPHARDGTVPRTFAQWANYPQNTIAPWLLVGGSYGIEGDPTDWNGNEPIWFFHFFLLEGKLNAKLLDLSGVAYPQRLLGRHTIAGHSGELYDQVSYSVCPSCSFTGHVTFVWSQHGVTYAASLHRWSPRPNPSALAILRALIAHLSPVHS